MQNIQTTLAYTDESLADGHGFVRIAFPDGKVIEERCLALMMSVVDEQSGELAKDNNGDLVYTPGIEFLFENGGCKNLPVFMQEVIGDRTLTETVLGEMVYRENSEAFKLIVLSHMETLDDDYWEKMRTYQGGIVFNDENNGKIISRDDVVNNYLNEAGLRVREYLNSYMDSEAIGEINGQSVFFSRTTGIYFYSGHDESLIILEIWITGGMYPPGY